MKTFSERSALLHKVRRALRKRFGRPSPETAEDVAQLLLIFILLEETSREVVEDALKRIERGFVDLNELRVSSPTEIAEVIPGVPHAQRKGIRLTKLFSAMFLKHNTMDWDFLRSMGVREVRQYFETIAGGDEVLGAAAVMLLAAGHAVPADTDVRRVLTRLDLIGRDEDTASVHGFLERSVSRVQGFEVWWLIRRLGESLCVVKTPLCGRCPLKAACKTGEARLTARKKAAAKVRTKTARKKKAPARKKASTGRKASVAGRKIAKRASKKKVARKTSGQTSAGSARKK